jgi:integrase
MAVGWIKISSALSIATIAAVIRTQSETDTSRYTSKLNVDKKCSVCGKSWGENPKYIGRIFHDFRRSAAHEVWRAGSSVDDCMKITGHKTSSMFKRYADLFSDEEKRAQQRAVQSKRREWKKAQADSVVDMPKRAAIQ